MSAAASGIAFVLEDEEADLETLRSSLEAQGAIVSAATELDGFAELLGYDGEDQARAPVANLSDAVNVDAVFVDWQLEGVEQGPQALDLSFRMCPDAATAVVTKHENRRVQAHDRAVDAFILKSSPNAEQRDLEARCLELGKLRRLKRALQWSGYGDPLPELPRGQLPRLGEHQGLKTFANAFCDQLFQTGRPSADVFDRLRSLGWRDQGVLLDFVSLPMRAKIASACTLLRLPAQTVEKLLECSSEIASQIVRGEETVRESSLAADLDRLASLFSFALQLAHYDRTLFSIAWSQRIIGNRPSDPPPWSGSPLEEYLVRTGRVGLGTALAWIRRS